MSIHDDLARATTAINEASSLALACHISPDGDALGSMLAFMHVMRADGRDVVASFPDPFVVAPHYRSLPGLNVLVPPAEFPVEPDVMVTFDCGSIARLGNLGDAAKAARQLIVIDHHKSNDRFGTLNVIDPTAASSGSVVRNLLAYLGLPLNEPAAVCLYCALVCDTGRFQYEQTTPEVFGLAQELSRFDVPITTLTRQLFEEHRFAYIQLMAAVLQRAVLRPDLKFVWSAITAADLEHYGVHIDETEGLIDVLRRTQEADVTVILKEAPDGSVRASLRSLGEVDVAAIADAFHGGGHRHAAGFTSELPVAVIGERLTELVIRERSQIAS
ncbi:MAG: DHH family phosphoesterase [Acidimicrobiia bacterium]